MRPAWVRLLTVMALLVASLTTLAVVGPARSAGAATTPPAYAPVTPSRLMDTRLGLGGAALGPGETRELTVAGRGGVPPTGARAVTLNVTVTEPTADGHLAVFPTGVARPTASNLNFVAGQTVPNAVTVGLGAGGRISLFNASGSTPLIVDVSGWYDQSPAFTPVTPARLMDTRLGLGGAALGPGQTRELTVAGAGGVPPTGAGAVTLNVTATEPTAQGHLTVFPTGVARPTASNLNFVPSQTVPNAVTVGLGEGGRISLFNSSGTTSVIVDVAGWFDRSPAFTPVTPSRLMDTRLGLGGAALAPGETRELTVAGRDGIPEAGAGAVTLNVTVTGPTAPGHLTVFPAGVARPTASNLNFIPRQTVPNAVTVGLGAGGRISLFNSSGTTPVIVDVSGWMAGNVPEAADTDAPQVAITAPAPDATIDLGLTGVFDLQGTASDAGSGIAALDILVGTQVVAAGVPVGSDHRWSVELAAAASGPAVYRARAADRAGNTAVADRRLVPQLPVPEAIVVSADVEIFTGPAAATVTSYDGASGQVRLSGDVTATVALGDALVADPSAAAPDGLLRRVTGISLVGAETVLSTAPATITDVVRQGSADVEQSLDDPPPPATPGQPRAAMASVFAAVSADLALISGPATLDAHAGARLSGRLHFRINIGVDWTWSGPDPFLRTLELWVSVDASVDASGAMTIGVEGKKERVLLDKKLPKIKFAIGVVPVWIQPTVVVKVGVTVKASGSLTWDWGVDQTWRAGVRFTRGGGWDKVNDHTETSRGTGPTPQLREGASVEVYADAQINTRFYDVAGPFLGVTPYLGASAERAISSTASTMDWELVLGLKGRVGADVRDPVFDKELASYDQQIFNLHRTLDSGTVIAPPLPPVLPVSITTTGLPGAVVGEPYTFTPAASGGSPPFTWTATGLPPWATISPTDGTIDGTPTTPGDTTISLQVQDGEGRAASADLTLTTSPSSGGGAGTIAAGGGHTCAVVSGGQVRCWGLNGYGQVGDGTTTDSAVPVTVTGLTGATAIAADGGHTCAVVFGGQVRCWGANWQGQLGDGTTTNSAVPVTVTGLTGATAIAAGGHHTCALIPGGQVRCWGWNGYGELGDGTTTNSAVPVTVTGLTGATAIAGGSEHTCALVSGGEIRCWGFNNVGQLGNGTMTNSAIPVPVTGLTGATAIAAGGGLTPTGGQTCAVVSGGQVRCWGWNGSGQLGDGTTTNSAIPVPVTGLTGATAIAAGGGIYGRPAFGHTCAVVSGGQVRCWGANEYGQLGNGTTTRSAVPVTVML